MSSDTNKESVSTVLVLNDDSELVREIVEATFRDHGFNVIKAGDGKRAREQFYSRTPDVVIKDTKPSLGLTLVQALAEQIDGSFSIAGDRTGTISTLIFSLQQ